MAKSQFTQTFLERELPQLGISTPATTMLRFWTMLAHYHGGIWNAADPARSLGLSQPTVRRYLDLLSDLFIIRQLAPWHENLKKRQIKSPKIYVRDSGLLHQLIGITTEKDLLSHPKSGSSWEDYAIEEVPRVARPSEAYFWATHTGAELDLLLMMKGRRIGVEVKRQDAPRLTPSMRSAMNDLRLDQLTVLYPGNAAYDLADLVRVAPLASLPDDDLSILLPHRRGRSRRTSRAESRP